MHFALPHHRWVCLSFLSVGKNSLVMNALWLEMRQTSLSMGWDQIRMIRSNHVSLLSMMLEIFSVCEVSIAVVEVSALIVTIERFHVVASIFPIWSNHSYEWAGLYRVSIWHGILTLSSMVQFNCHWYFASMNHWYPWTSRMSVLSLYLEIRFGGIICWDQS